MKNWKAVLLLGACLIFSGFASNSAFAQSPNASVYVVHGIPGHDVNEALDPALPVDVQVDGSICLVSGLKFGDIAGPFTIPANTTTGYSLVVSLANTLTPCGNSGSPVLRVSGVTFEAGENASVVAYLTDGSGPALKKFDNKLNTTLDPIKNGESRLIVQHTANAPAVDITVSEDQFTVGDHKIVHPLATLHDVTNGEQATADFSSGSLWNWPQTQVTLTPAGAKSPVIGPYYFQLVPHTAYLIYAVGSLSTESFTLITKAIPGI
jgi:hypothetical protein